jgi:uncharacterized membrane protein YqgA involved in biofilm formation
MDLATLFPRTSGTWLNTGVVLLGTVVGLLVAERLPARMQAIMVQGVGLVTLVIGLGINLLGLTRVRVASFLPALALAPLLHFLAALVE